jgi:hypothetical protein
MKKTLVLATTLAGLCGNAWPQSCPTPIDPPPCLNLALGEVALLDVHPGTGFCVAPQADLSEYTMVPVNVSATSDIDPAFMATDVVPVTGPPAPRPDQLLPQIGVLEDVAPTGEFVAVEPGPELPELALAGRQERLIRNRRPGETLAVGDRFTVQVALGCNGTPDLRIAEVMAEGTLGPDHMRLIVAREVIEDPPGTFTPYPSVGFAAIDYATFVNGWEQDPPGTTGGAVSFLRSDVRDVLIAHYGDTTDVDNNNSVIVFVTAAMNQISPPASSVVVPARFLARDLLDPASCPLSNGREIIYAMAADPTGQVNSNVRTISFVSSTMIRSIAMQMVRMINAGRRMYVTSAPLEENWLDGALAWTVGELLFYRASMGLAPKNNISLSMLTTGPNAPQRVSAFNTFVNTSFGTLRSWLQQGSSSAAAFRFGPLQPNPPIPPPALPLATTDELTSIYHGVTSVFLRYAFDRADLGDATMLQLLLDSGLTGKANLDAVIGADASDWLRDFIVANYADDAIPSVEMAPPYRNPSWNYRSVFGGLGVGFPLAPNALNNGVGFMSTYGQLGGTRWLRFGIAADAPAPATINSTPGAAATLTPMRVAIVRTK